jgi:hypothetical protein
VKPALAKSPGVGKPVERRTMSDARNHPARDTAGGGIRDLATRRVLRREGAYCADRHAPEDWPLVIAKQQQGPPPEDWPLVIAKQQQGPDHSPTLDKPRARRRGRGRPPGRATVTRVERLLATPSAQRAGTRADTGSAFGTPIPLRDQCEIAEHCRSAASWPTGVRNDELRRNERRRAPMN